MKSVDWKVKAHAFLVSIDTQHIVMMIFAVKPAVAPTYRE
jgi:hypothetical protein